MACALAGELKNNNQSIACFGILGLATAAPKSSVVNSTSWGGDPMISIPLIFFSLLSS